MVIGVIFFQRTALKSRVGSWAITRVIPKHETIHEMYELRVAW